jgi:hypothetical protein
MQEEWRAIPGFEGSYEVSDMGRVRSLERKIWSSYKGKPYLKRVKPCVLKPQKHSGGYAQISLSGTVKLIHWLVLEAFVSLRPEGMIGCHNFGNKNDNSLANIRWDTPAENTRDMHAHGTDGFGERNPMHKLKMADVVMIRSRCMSGEHQKSVASDFGIRQAHVSRLVRKTRWPHV